MSTKKLAFVRKATSLTQIQYEPTYDNRATASSNCRVGDGDCLVKRAQMERRTVQFYSKKLKEVESLLAKIDRNESKILADLAAES